MLFIQNLQKLLIYPLG